MSYDFFPTPRDLHVDRGPQQKPARGEVWRFRDGTEGVVTSCNTMSTTVYVGPAAYMIPVGDVDLVFGHAARVDDAAEAAAHAAAIAAVVAPGPAVFRVKHGTAERWDVCECEDCVTAKQAAVVTIVDGTSPPVLAVYKDPANVTQAEHDAMLMAAIADAQMAGKSSITITADPPASRRGRKRKSDTEVK